MKEAYHYLVVGAGNVGKATCFDLKMHGNAGHISVVDTNKKQVADAYARMRQAFGEESARADFTYTTDLKEAIKDRRPDIIVSCASHAANLALTKVAIAEKIPYCDLGGHHEIVEEQARMVAALKDVRGVSVVPDCGVSPGTANILAADLARKGCTRIKVRCGGNLAARPDPKQNPLLYKPMFSPEGIAREYTADAAAIRGGKLVTIPALSERDMLLFRHGGNTTLFESAPTANNSHFAAKHLLSLGVCEYDYGTLRYDGHFDQVRTYLGALHHDGKEEDLARWARSWPVYDREQDRDRLTLALDGGREHHGEVVEMRYSYDILSDPLTKFTAMELTTSWGIGSVAYHMVGGWGRPLGFSTPEVFVKGDWYRKEFDKRRAAFNMH